MKNYLNSECFNTQIIAKLFPILAQLFKGKIMYVSETQLRVRYAETDKMGYVYYGNYAQYYEVGRVEAMRQLGLSYKVMEDDGIMMPVLSFKIKYIKPAFYDDVITIKTTIKEIPQLRILFEYESYNQDGVLLNVGETTLVFIDMIKNKTCLPPPEFLKRLGEFFI
jgi:acyl-CoA thioester hydrolase